MAPKTSAASTAMEASFAKCIPLCDENTLLNCNYSASLPTGLASLVAADTNSTPRLFRDGVYAFDTCPICGGSRFYVQGYQWCCNCQNVPLYGSFSDYTRATRNVYRTAMLFGVA